MNSNAWLRSKSYSFIEKYLQNAIFKFLLIFISINLYQIMTLACICEVINFYKGISVYIIRY